jgi:hypothetical protein
MRASPPYVMVKGAKGHPRVRLMTKHFFALGPLRIYLGVGDRSVSGI